MPKHRVALWLLAGTLASPAWPHHSGAMFDATREQTITGTVTQFNWTNPHSSFKVNVSPASGSDEIWAVEMNSPQNLIRLGWKRITIKSGDKVRVVVHPLRDGKPGGSFVSITLPDGRTLTGSAPGQNNAYTAAPASAAPAASP
jgi:hypothetical protein